jgi:carboxylesterase type B
MGLIDQVLALKWIKNNIKYFGGDSKDITLFGESAGAFSIGFHMMSPMSRHLFKRAILQSGSPLNPQIFEEQQLAIERANQIAGNVGCADDRITLMEKPELVVNCLRNVEAMRLIEEEEKLMEGFHPPFGVTIGDEFMPKHPYEALKNGEIGSQKEVMIGTNADEGSFFLHYTFPEIFSADLPKNVTAEEAILYLEDSFKFLPQPMPKLITHFFLSGFDSQDYERIRKAFYETIGDFIILCPTVYFSEKLTEQNVNVYYYFFTYRPQNTNWTKWMGVTHFEEVQFVFGTPFIKLENYTPEEREFSTKLMDMWTNFAKNG